MIELAVCTPVLLLLLFGAADFGRLYYAAIEVQSAAAAGAAYGSLKAANIGDAAGIASAAMRDAADLRGLEVSSAEVCQDEGGAAMSCAGYGVSRYVSVTARFEFRTTVSYPFVPSSVVLTRTVMMRGA